MSQTLVLVLLVGLFVFVAVDLVQGKPALLPPEGAKYQCFKNDGAPDDYHYYFVNSTDTSGNIVYQGYDHVVGTGDFALTGTYNVVSRTYSFNTNQPPYIYINQWSEDSHGNRQPGFIYAIVASPSDLTEPVGFSTFASTFSVC